MNFSEEAMRGRARYARLEKLSKIHNQRQHSALMEADAKIGIPEDAWWPVPRGIEFEPEDDVLAKITEKLTAFRQMLKNHYQTTLEDLIVTGQEPVGEALYGLIPLDPLVQQCKDRIKTEKYALSATHREASGAELVYGPIDESFVFIPATEIQYYAALRRALDFSATWGEFKVRMPEAYKEVIQMMIENQVYSSPDEYFQDSDDELSAEERQKQFQKLKAGVRLPESADEFESAMIPGLEGGDWPRWHAQEMLTWIPEKIQETYGRREASFLNGYCLTFEPKVENDLVKELESYGYICRRDDWLICQACGHTGTSQP